MKDQSEAEVLASRDAVEEIKFHLSRTEQYLDDLTTRSIGLMSFVGLIQLVRAGNEVVFDGGTIFLLVFFFSTVSFWVQRRLHHVTSFPCFSGEGGAVTKLMEGRKKMYIDMLTNVQQSCRNAQYYHKISLVSASLFVLWSVVITHINPVYAKELFYMLTVAGFLFALPLFRTRIYKEEINLR